MKKILLLLLLLLSFCGTSAASFRDDLLTLEGVVSVDEIVQSGDSMPFAEKYLVTFVQYIDWNNPDLGTFPQRVEIGFKGYDNVNVMYVSGYELTEDIVLRKMMIMKFPKCTTEIIFLSNTDSSQSQSLKDSQVIVRLCGNI